MRTLNLLQGIRDLKPRYPGVDLTRGRQSSVSLSRRALTSPGGFSDPRCFMIAQTLATRVKTAAPSEVMEGIAKDLALAHPREPQEPVFAAYRFAHELTAKSMDTDGLYHGLTVARLLTDWGAPPRCVAAGLLTTFSTEGAKLSPEVESLLNRKKIIDAYLCGDISTQNRDLIVTMLLLLVESPLVYLIQTAHDYISLIEDDSRISGYAANHFHRVTPLLMRLLGHPEYAKDMEEKTFLLAHPKRMATVREAVAPHRVDRNTITGLCEATKRGLEASTTLQAMGVTKISIQDDQKSFFSIGRKMEKGKKLNDLNRFRVIINGPDKSCYTALDTISASLAKEGWTIVSDPKAHDDYIEHPKGNNYRSLHYYFEKDDYTLEAQIRTEEMHLTAELGSARHWQYHETKANQVDYYERLAAAHRQTSIIFVDQSFRPYEVSPDTKLKPDGEITILDAAFAIDRELGLHCPTDILRVWYENPDGTRRSLIANRTAPVKTGDIIIWEAAERKTITPAEARKLIHTVGTREAYDALNNLLRA
ncbi:MAG: hypothetical protein ABIE84_02950 [bacterium]